ncbi:MAG: DEAD/DEAH box helicase [Ignavibacteria bacterium]|nr:DEAD/DEAH box helicase [Ignavibacteria bacterium]MBK7445009.1 DEAD/DEAH box helicase [Ignavibacteria bacterium]MBK9403278.1 DEAD/DEAH box helicase [Ignavibacteria bacterium]
MKTLKFDELNLSKEIQKAVEEMGFEEATPIQSEAIPAIMSGKDIIGQAQTGTGKTASFGIPLIEAIDKHSKNIQALVLCPTRELAIQVAEEMNNLLKYVKTVKVVPIYGGQSIDRQIKILKFGVQIVIATPGRLIDHINRGTLNLENVKMVVLDEADEMLDMGFRDDIEKILKTSPKERQTVMFSATMPRQIMDLSKKYLKNAEHIKVVHKELTVPNVNQYFFELKPNMKLDVLTRLIDIHDPKLSLVFCNTKRVVDELVSHLQARGYFAEGLHGDMKQMMRDRVMSKFRNGTLEILVATDVAARGIDVEEIDAVFNYDMPQDEEYYVHRIGRTARAGRAGQAFTFAVGKDFNKIKEIERYTKTKIVRQQIPSLKDVEEIRLNSLIEDVKKVLDGKEDMKRYIHIVERLHSEEYSSEEIASALLKMIIGKEEESMKTEEKFSSMSSNSYERESGNRNRSGGKDGRKGKDRKDNFRGSNDSFRGSSDSDMVRLFINIGTKAKIKVNDVVGAIAGETGIPGKSIGEVAMFDKFCFVEIPKTYSDKVIKIMNKNQIKGNKIAIQVANDR